MAFKESYINEVNQQSQGIRNISQGIQSAAVLAMGISGFAGGLGEGALAKGAEHALAGRVGGIGGNIMLAALNQKKESAKANTTITDMQKQLGTVYEVLNSKGNIESSIGDIDPSSELGKRVITELSKKEGE